MRSLPNGWDASKTAVAANSAMAAELSLTKSVEIAAIAVTIVNVCSSY